MVFLYILQPLFEKLAAKIPSKAFTIITGIMAALFLTDTAVTFLLPVLR